MGRIRLTKKKIATLAIIVALLSIAAMGTLAYYTDEVVMHNVITSGAVDITLNDQTEIDGVLVDFPEGGISGVMPGKAVSKVVSVTGEDAAAWVRIHLTHRIVGANGADLPLTLSDGTPAYTLNTADNGWALGADGCWYYADPVYRDDTTPVLFDTVTFAPELGNEYQGSKVYIDVQAQAVQYANNPIPDGGTHADIDGWPSLTP